MGLVYKETFGPNIVWFASSLMLIKKIIPCHGIFLHNYLVFLSHMGWEGRVRKEKHVSHVGYCSLFTGMSIV